MWSRVGTSVAGVMFAYAMFKQYSPFDIEEPIQKYAKKLAALFYPYIHITFHEHNGEGFGQRRSKAYVAIERYLSTNSTTRAKRLKADMVQDSKSLVLSMDDYEEITDEFMGVKVRWVSQKRISHQQVISLYGEGNDGKRYYQLKFHKKDREIITGLYLKHVMEEGRAIEVKNRQRKLYTNNRGEHDGYGQRKKKKEKDEEGDEKDPIIKKMKEDAEKSNKSSEVTLSGLLNFIDGLWSACGGERIIVFTTNYVDKLDPALIRRGRMDKHIELSYCCFEAFKVLARNYLDLESHDLFETIKKLLEENNMTPADVAENLMPKSPEDGADACLTNLVDAIEKAKEEAKAKAEEEEKERLEDEEKKRLQAEKEEKAKEEKEQKSCEEVKEMKTTVEEVKENGVKVTS
ncbi:hypothetical protein Vadar_013980 [Vaccinium darrowii]|uniref:Uncharacterized protein n=1 Tax=Vaccinium darrowii TaxID=229202 RepID=A0ACB7XZB7_9ERIC|nr:hypothetical protein Vadar_013980 [Vaccinium darrowii]